jgi:4'-phosphopantetheinyl transferase
VLERLDSGRICLWLAHIGEIVDPQLLAAYRSLLSEEELLKQARFHFERDRHRYLVTRAMVRTVLSKYAGVAPRDWRFAANRYGRPSIAPELRTAQRIEFNVSHTDGLVVLAVTCGRAIGVDVENMRSRAVDIAIADRCFAPAEAAALRALPPQQQRRRFFEYWTLKESYIKARGMGLSIPLKQFAFEIEDATRIQLTLDPCLQDLAERWTFWQVELQNNHLAAICAGNDGSWPPNPAQTRRWP